MFMATVGCQTLLSWKQSSDHTFHILPLAFSFLPSFFCSPSVSFSYGRVGVECCVRMRLIEFTVSYYDIARC